MYCNHQHSLRLNHNFGALFQSHHHNYTVQQQLSSFRAQSMQSSLKAFLLIVIQILSHYFSSILNGKMLKGEQCPHLKFPLHRFEVLIEWKMCFKVKHPEWEQ
jgi:hypothetical protein